MLPPHLFLVMLILACPIFVVLHAVSLVVPLYLVLLVLGLGTLYITLRTAAEFLFEEVFSLLAILIGMTCSIAGFALAPLLIQIATAITLLAAIWRYPVDVKVG